VGLPSAAGSYPQPAATGNQQQAAAASNSTSMEFKLQLEPGKKMEKGCRLCRRDIQFAAAATSSVSSSKSSISGVAATATSFVLHLLPAQLLSQ